jgi:hypothetical protein
MAIGRIYMCVYLCMHIKHINGSNLCVAEKVVEIKLPLNVHFRKKKKRKAED